LCTWRRPDFGNVTTPRTIARKSCVFNEGVAIPIGPLFTDNPVGAIGNNSPKDVSLSFVNEIGQNSQEAIAAH
jgi:hypothetical protein